MSVRKVLAVTVAAVALAGSQLLAGSAVAADGVQGRIDSYLAAHPGERQLAADRATMPGGTVTFAAAGTAAISCGSGHLCIQDGNGKRYDYYYCGYYDFYGIGDGYFNNSQTNGTVARFYNQNGTERWSSRAPQSGTASWTPVWHIRPC